MNDENLPVKQEKATVPIVDGKFAPTDFDGLYRLAKIMTSTEMVPDEYQKQPEKAFVAMQMGMELGLSFMASLQCITVVKGKPTVYADGVTGLINGSGKLEDVEEGYKIGDKEVDPADMPLNLDEWPDNFKAYCIMQRKGRSKPYKGSFSVADAKRMGKWNKATSNGRKSIWQQWPARMLQWRARTNPSRDGFSDVLKGIAIYEEVIDYDADMTPANGHYEMKDSDGDFSTVQVAFQELMKENNLDVNDTMEFIKISAAAADCSEEALMSAALESFDDFTVKYFDYCSRKPMGVGSDPDHKPANSVETKEAPEKDPIDQLKDDLYVALDNWIGEPQVDFEKYDYMASLDNYIEYVAALTKKTPKYYIDLWLKKGAGNYVKYFLGWLDQESKKSEPVSDEYDDGDPMGIDEPAECRCGTCPECVGDIGQSGNLEPPPEKPASLGSGPYQDGPKQSYKKEWVGKIGSDFSVFVKAHPNKFDPSVIGQEEYEAAVQKWNKLVYARTKESWPYEIDADNLGEPEEKKPSQVEFPEQTVKQRFAEMTISNPVEMKKAIDKLKFAKGGLSDAAMEKAIEVCKEFIGEEMTK